jgi:ribosomal protein S18 acetylase RimI-like enzyme
MDVRDAAADDAEFVRTTLTDSWGGTVQAIHGELIDAAALPALVAWRSEERVGLLTYRPDGGSWEIVSLDATVPGIGAGTALLTAIRERAWAHGVHRVWLITTNDNTSALRFYQRRGFDLVAVNRDAVTQARRLKPTIPLTADGVPIRHELVLEASLPART